MKTNSEHNLVWIDLEMSGLDPTKDVILEIATLITNPNLEIIAQGPSLVIGHDQKIIDSMGEWCKNQHHRSGLSADVVKSTITLAQAEHETLSFIHQHCPPGTGLLAGNSVWQDRLFLATYMPSITSHLYYKMVDVSAVAILIYQWYPENNKKEYFKQDKHRAMDDIKESLQELIYLRENFFIPPLSF